MFLNSKQKYHGSYHVRAHIQLKTDETYQWHSSKWNQGLEVPVAVVQHHGALFGGDGAPGITWDQVAVFVLDYPKPVQPEELRQQPHRPSVEISSWMKCHQLPHRPRHNHPHRVVDDVVEASQLFTVLEGELVAARADDVGSEGLDVLLHVVRELAADGCENLLTRGSCGVHRHSDDAEKSTQTAATDVQRHVLRPLSREVHAAVVAKLRGRRDVLLVFAELPPPFPAHVSPGETWMGSIQRVWEYQWWDMLC